MPRKQSTPNLDQEAMHRHAGSAAKLVRALSNEHRLMVVCALSAAELSVGQLNELVQLSPSALSQHLAVLRREGLVSTRRHAQTIYYRVTPGIALDVVRLLYEHYCGGRKAGKTRPSPQTRRRTRVEAGAKTPI